MLMAEVAAVWFGGPGGSNSGRNVGKNAAHHVFVACRRGAGAVLRLFLICMGTRS